MTAREAIPDHLSGGPTIDEADFVLGAFTREEVTEIHTAVIELSEEVRNTGNPNETRYLVLGNYDEEKKRRLVESRELLEYFDPGSMAFLLSEIDRKNENWENFYIKFLYTLSFVDHPVLVAEDNDGGHELELGEVPLSETYVVKRDYEIVSIRHDVEYEMYDAMIGKLFEVMKRKHHLFEWHDVHSFTRAVQNVATETKDTYLDTALNDQSDRLPPTTAEPAGEETIDRRSVDVSSNWENKAMRTEIDVPDRGTIDLFDPPAELTGDELRDHKPVIISYGRKLDDGAKTSVNVVHRYLHNELSFRLETSIGHLPGGRTINRTITTDTDLDELDSMARQITQTFDQKYAETNDPEKALRYAGDRIKDQSND